MAHSTPITIPTWGSTRPMADRSDETSRPSSGEPRPTARGAWIALIVVNTVMATALVPRLISRLQQTVPADIAEGVNDPQLLSSALKVGAYLSVPLHAVVLLVFALIARSFERHVNPGSTTVGRRLRVGAGWVLVTLTTVPVHVLTLLGVEWRTVPIIGAIVVVSTASACLMTRATFRCMSPGRRVLAVVLSIGLVLAMTLGK